MSISTHVSSMQVQCKAIQALSDAWGLKQHRQASGKCLCLKFSWPHTKVHMLHIEGFSYRMIYIHVERNHSKFTSQYFKNKDNAVLKYVNTLQTTGFYGLVESKLSYLITSHCKLCYKHWKFTFRKYISFQKHCPHYYMTLMFLWDCFFSTRSIHWKLLTVKYVDYPE